MKANAFVPGHITGFFEVFEHKDALQTGSRGCGVVINKGVYTTVKIKGSEKNEIYTHINGETSDCPVTKTAVNEILELINGKYKIEVFHELEVPMKYGFGASASGTLGSILAMSKALGLNMTLNQVGAIAHRAEVLNKTGLGDVIAECNGGVVVREKPGAPGIGKIDKILCNDYVVAFVVGEELETKSILRDSEKRDRINEIGRKCMSHFLKNPSVENFLGLSKKFASETKLMSEKVRSALKRLEESNVQASMIMLGNSVFTLTSEPEEVCDLLDYMYITARVDNMGARVL